MTHQFDDAVTAFRNGKHLRDLGFSAAEVSLYRAVYIAGMTFNITPFRDKEAAKRLPIETMALEDVDMDRKYAA